MKNRPSPWEWGCFLIWAAVGALAVYGLYCEAVRVLKNAGDSLRW